MNSPYWHSEYSHPRPQAERIVRILSREEFAFRGVLLGGARQGKTDLLWQIQATLFEGAEGPIPFYYTFPEQCDDIALAHHFVTAFCQQARAFLMRQDDMLSEPVGDLERELERAGMPLSLAELARNFLSLSAAHQLEFAANLPAHFAHRELRPVCLLLDDVHTLHPASPFFSSLDSHHLSWVLTGRQPAMSRIAVTKPWPVTRLEPFSSEELLALCKKACRAAAIEFTPDVWGRWPQIAGISPWPVSCLLTSSALGEQRLDSAEQAARAYIQQLSSGTLGNWLSSRLERAVPDRKQRLIALQLLAHAAIGSSRTTVSVSLPPETWQGLIVEEWAQDDVDGPRILLDQVQRDWVQLRTSADGNSTARAEARLLLTVLSRAEDVKDHAETARFSAVIRQRLLDLPRSGFPESFRSEGREIRIPRIFSVCAEAADTAELFWCYGFYEEGQRLRKSPVVLLIVICDELPADAQVTKWVRESQNESTRVLPEAARVAADRQSFDLRHDAWVVVPPGTSLDAASSERRFSWEAFFRLAVQDGTADHQFPSSDK
jgi:hypothetical protein